MQNHKFFYLLFLLIIVSACTSTGANSPETEQTTPSATKTPPLATLVNSQELNGGGTVSLLTISSPALGTEQAVKIYEPPGLEETQPVPVVYLLHGQKENEQMWQTIGIFAAADKLIASEEIDPLIIVTPNIDNSFGVNNTESGPFAIPNGPTVYYDGNRYEDFLAEDLINYIDANYSTIPERSGRYIGGISMGGFAALHLAFRHPELFSKVGGHSPALITDPNFTWLYPEDVPIESRNPFLIAEQADLSELEVHLDVGEQDEWGLLTPTRDMAAHLEGLGVNVHLIVAPGRHNSAYWNANLETYLRFYANGNL